MLEPWLAGGIHHIGATSVRGLAAKPLLDMMAGIRAFEEARGAYAPLLAEGWSTRRTDPESRTTFRGPGSAYI